MNGWALLFLAPVVGLGLVYLVTVSVVIWASNEPEQPERDRFR